MNQKKHRVSAPRLRHLARTLAAHDAAIEDARDCDYSCALKAAQARTAGLRNSCRRAVHAHRTANAAFI